MEIIGQNVTIFTDIKNLQILCETLLQVDMYIPIGFFEGYQI